MGDTKYIIPDNLDISRLSELSGLENLELWDIAIDSKRVEQWGSFNNLHTLAIHGVNIERQVVMPNIPTLKTLSISFLEDLRTFQNHTGIKKLTIYNLGSIQNIELLRTFINLECINIPGLPRVDSYLPNTQTLVEISLEKCDISDVSFLEQYNQLQRVDLSENPLDNSALGKLKDLIKRGVKIKLEDTPLIEHMKIASFSGLTTEKLNKLRRK